MRFEIPWHWPLVIALLLYLVSAAAVVVGRLGFERRRRLLSRIDRAMQRQSPAAAGGEAASGMEVLSGVSAGRARRLPFEHRVPRHVNEVLARFLVAAGGLERLTATASGRGRRVTRWKRIAALRLLALARPVEALPVLEAATHDSDQEVVAAAVATLGRVSDPEAARVLVNVLRTNRFAPSRVATFLDRFSLDIPEALRPLLGGDTATARFWGAVLAHRYRQVAWVEQELTRLAGDPAPIVRKGAIQSLARFRTPNAVAVATGALTDSTWYVRAHAARAIGELNAADHATDVTALLTDKEWWVRQAAKDALIMMGTGAEAAVVACLTHPDRFARNSAAEVLQNTGAFERLLTEEMVGGGAAPPGGMLALICRAGGKRLAEAVVHRLPPELRLRARAALASLEQSEAPL